MHFCNLSLIYCKTSPKKNKVDIKSKTVISTKSKIFSFHSISISEYQSDFKFPCQLKIDSPVCVKSQF